MQRGTPIEKEKKKIFIKPREERERDQKKICVERGGGGDKKDRILKKSEILFHKS